MKISKKESVTNKVFLYLIDTSKNLLNLGIDIIFDPKKIVRFKSYGNNISYYNHRNAYNLKRSPYFSFKNNTFYLTEKGRIKIIKDIIQNKKNQKIWNKKWLAIIFDIPEITRRERDFLRKELKWMRLKELQHSVWITPYDIKKELLALLGLWHKDFRGDIRFLEINKITEDKDIKKFFNL